MSISQYGEQIAVGQWRGKLTQHVYDSPEAMCHYERLEAQKAQAKAQMPNPLERLSTAEIEEVTRAFVHQIAEAERQTAFRDEADIFLHRHPEFVNSPANGTAMVTALTLAGKKHTATALDMEQCLRDAA